MRVTTKEPDEPIRNCIKDRDEWSTINNSREITNNLSWQNYTLG